MATPSLTPSDIDLADHISKEISEMNPDEVMNAIMGSQENTDMNSAFDRAAAKINAVRSTTNRIKAQYDSEKIANPNMHARLLDSITTPEQRIALAEEDMLAQNEQEAQREDLLKDYNFQDLTDDYTSSSFADHRETEEEKSDGTETVPSLDTTLSDQIEVPKLEGDDNNDLGDLNKKLLEIDLETKTPNDQDPNSGTYTEDKVTSQNPLLPIDPLLTLPSGDDFPPNTKADGSELTEKDEHLYELKTEVVTLISSSLKEINKAIIDSSQAISQATIKEIEKLSKEHDLMTQSIQLIAPIITSMDAHTKAILELNEKMDKMQNEFKALSNKIDTLAKFPDQLTATINPLIKVLGNKPSASSTPVSAPKVLMSAGPSKAPSGSPMKRLFPDLSWDAIYVALGASVDSLSKNFDKDQNDIYDKIKNLSSSQIVDLEPATLFVALIKPNNHPGLTNVYDFKFGGGDLVKRLTDFNEYFVKQASAVSFSIPKTPSMTLVKKTTVKGTSYF